MKKSFLFAAVIAMVAMAATSCKKDPVADFKYAVDDENLTITFTNASKYADVYAWDFGDGSEISAETNPVHQYAEAGSYTVKLTASSKDGQDIKEVRDIEVGEIMPQGKINLKDNSIADWNALPQEKIAKAELPEGATYLGLKKAWVYADNTYIYTLIEYDPEEIPDRTSVPFHVYINVNNSDETGGYQGFPDANTDILMEGFFFAAEFDGETPLDEGSPCDYEPTVFAWSGEVGADGWAWDELTSNPFCKTQHVTGNYVELQMMRELIPTPAGVAWNADAFTIGFDIQQAWENVGVLPLVAPTDDNTAGKSAKMEVRFDKE